MKNESATDTTKSKRIKVYLNGRGHCHDIPLNPREMKGWTAILDHLTEILNPVRHISELIALSSMKRVECFNDLDPEENYVALEPESKFKQVPGGYGNTTQRELAARKKTKRYYIGETDPSLKAFLNETRKKNLTVVYLLVNGKTCQCPHKIVLSRCDLKRSVVTKNYIAKIMDVPDGIQYVATVFGNILCQLREMEHGFPYVVIQFNKPFIKMDYLQFFRKQSGCKLTLNFNIKPARPSSAGGRSYSATSSRQSIPSSTPPSTSPTTPPSTSPSTPPSTPRSTLPSEPSSEEEKPKEENIVDGKPSSLVLPGVQAIYIGCNCNSQNNVTKDEKVEEVSRKNSTSGVKRSTKDEIHEIVEEVIRKNSTSGVKRSSKDDVVEEVSRKNSTSGVKRSSKDDVVEEVSRKNSTSGVKRSSCSRVRIGECPQKKSCNC